MSAVRRAVALALAERSILGVLTVAQTAIVSRLLRPDEIGIALIGMATFQVIDSLRDFGTTNYLIQKQHLSQRNIRSVFTILMLASACAAMLLIGCSKYFSDYYARPGLAAYVHVLSLSFLILPISAPRMALMRRDFRFGALTATNVGSALAYAVTVMALAALGVGFMSVAWAALASACAAALISLCVRADVWMFRPCLADCREALSFGGCASATNLLNRAYELLPIFVLGRLFSPDAVGLYSRALVVSQLPDRLLLSSVAGIVLPTFALDARQKALKASYLAGLGYVAVIQWPVLVLLALTAEPVVRLLLGSQWVSVVPLVQIMALASTVTFAAVLSSPILVASGGVVDTLTSSLISLSLSSVVIFAASALGPFGVAASFLVTLPLQMAVVVHFIRRRLDITWREIGTALRRSALVTLASAVLPGAVVVASGGFDLSAALAVVSAAGAFAGWSIGIVAFAHPIYPHLRASLSAFATRGSSRFA